MTEANMLATMAVLEWREGNRVTARRLWDAAKHSARLFMDNQGGFDNA